MKEVDAGRTSSSEYTAVAAKVVTMTNTTGRNLSMKVKFAIMIQMNRNQCRVCTYGNGIGW